MNITGDGHVASLRWENAGGGAIARMTDSHDHGDDHAAEALGPMDVRVWGAALLGIALGLVVAVCFFVATAATRS